MQYKIPRIVEIKSLLLRHDYVPQVRKMGDGVTLRMPHPSLIRPAYGRLFETYAIRRGVEAGLYYSSNLDQTERFASVPEYAIRMMLMAKIVSHCERMAISQDVTCYFDEDGREHPRIEDIVALPSTDEEAAREGFLVGLVTEARTEDFPSSYEEVALAHGVHGGYQLIRSFFSGARI